MKGWTNGLPDATTRLGAKMAHRGLSPSQPGCARIPMMVRSRICSTQRPDALDAALTFVALVTPSCNARSGRAFGTSLQCRPGKKLRRGFGRAAEVADDKRQRLLDPNLDPISARRGRTGRTRWDAVDRSFVFSPAIPYIPGLHSTSQHDDARIPRPGVAGSSLATITMECSQPGFAGEARRSRGAAPSKAPAR